MFAVDETSRFTGRSGALAWKPLSGFGYIGVGAAGWSALPTALPDVSDSGVEAWLESAAQGSGIRMMSGHALLMITQAPKWLLKQSAQVIGAGLGTTLMVGATLLDQMAWLLGRGIEFSKMLVERGVALMRAVLAFLGRAGTTAVEMSTGFIRWVLEMLFSTVKSVAWRAVSRL